MSPERAQSFTTILERGGPCHAGLCGAKKVAEGQWCGTNPAIGVILFKEDPFKCYTQKGGLLYGDKVTGIRSRWTSEG